MQTTSDPSHEIHQEQEACAILPRHAAAPPPADPPRRSAARAAGLVGRLLLGLALVAGLLLMGAMPRMKQNKKLQAMAAAHRDEQALVEVVSPHTAAGSSAVTLPGNVQAVEETVINARTSGYLRRRFVDIGSKVHAGQVVAEIEAPELDQQLLRAQAETSKSRAGREQAEADVAKLTANVQQAQSELARMQSNVETARADLAHSKAKLVQVQGARSEAASKVSQAQSAKSEAIAKLDQVQKHLAGQRAILKRARARSAFAETTLKRWRQLEAGGVISGQDLDEKQADYDTAQANVAAAQADVESAQADVDAARHAIEARTSDVEAARHALEARAGDVAAAQADITAGEQKVNSAQAAVASAQANVGAMQAAVQAGRANSRAAQANIEASKATVQGYASLIGFERVRAPFNGVITARNVDTGALINAGSGSSSTADPTSTVPHSGLFGIARTDALRVQVQVPQPFVALARQGQRARVLVQEYPGRSFDGLVAQTAGALDATSRTLLTEVRVTNRDGLLMPGMYAQVQFLGKQSRASLRIPANSLIVDGSGVRVATVGRNKHLHFQQVKVGKDFGKEVEITEGLVGNEQLVSNPTDELTEGMTVRVASERR